MKGKTLSTYTAALFITIFGAGATLLIVDAAHSAADPLYTVTDPLYEDFER